MDEIKVNKILFWVGRWSGYGLVVIMVLYFISGYGMTKGIMDPVFATSLHVIWLPIPFVVFLLFHVLFRLRSFLRKRINDETWVNVYILIFSLVILTIAFYLYFL